MPLVFETLVLFLIAYAIGLAIGALLWKRSDQGG